MRRVWLVGAVVLAVVAWALWPLLFEPSLPPAPVAATSPAPEPVQASRSVAPTRAAPTVAPRSTRPSRPAPPVVEPEEPEVDERLTSLRVVVREGGQIPFDEVTLQADGCFLFRQDAAQPRPYARADEDGVFMGYLVPARPGHDRCRLAAVRWDGSLQARSPWSEVRVRPGTRQHLDLELPSAEIGGIGVGILRHPDGIEVTHVVPGGPADGLGLEVGDIFVEVEGRAVAGMDELTFTAAMTGPVGSRVSFTVGFESDEGWVEQRHIVRRARVERRW